MCCSADILQCGLLCGTLGRLDQNILYAGPLPITVMQFRGDAYHVERSGRGAFC